MTQIKAGVVDVYVIHLSVDGGWRILVLRRAENTRCPGAWETVHGRIEHGERPEQAAVREVREETGLAVDRLYSITVQPFYLHAVETVQLAVVFASFVRDDSVVLGEEHREYAWLDVQSAIGKFAWPRESAALQEIVHLLQGGDAGTVEDVLRVF